MINPEMKDRLEWRVRYSLQMMRTLPLMEFHRAIEELFFNSDSKEEAISLLLQQIEAEMKYRGVY